MRILIAGIIGGLVMFVWGAVAHMMLPIGEMGMTVDGHHDTLLWSGDPAEHDTADPIHLHYVAPQGYRPTDMVALDDHKDPNVFYRKEYVYGVDGRANAGYGFWQMAYASKGDLDAANYELARKTMAGHRDDEGNPLGVRGDLLVVPGSLEGPARRLLERSQVAGSDNEWAGTAKLLVVDWL